MHTLFALEDLYGLKINSIDGEVCLTLDKHKGMTYVSMFEMFYVWQKEAEKLKNGEITKEQYDQWKLYSNGFKAHLMYLISIFYENEKAN